jgi:hypothetical protein
VLVLITAAIEEHAEDNLGSTTYIQSIMMIGAGIQVILKKISQCNVGITDLRDL